MKTSLLEIAVCAGILLAAGRDRVIAADRDNTCHDDLNGVELVVEQTMLVGGPVINIAMSPSGRSTVVCQKSATGKESGFEYTIISRPTHSAVRSQLTTIVTDHFRECAVISDQELLWNFDSILRFNWVTSSCKPLVLTTQDDSGQLHHDIPSESEAVCSSPSGNIIVAPSHEDFVLFNLRDGRHVAYPSVFEGMSAPTAVLLTPSEDRLVFCDSLTVAVTDIPVTAAPVTITERRNSRWSMTPVALHAAASTEHADFVALTIIEDVNDDSTVSACEIWELPRHTSRPRRVQRYSSEDHTPAVLCSPGTVLPLSVGSRHGTGVVPDGFLLVRDNNLAVVDPEDSVSDVTIHSVEDFCECASYDCSIVRTAASGDGRQFVTTHRSSDNEGGTILVFWQVQSER